MAEYRYPPRHDVDAPLETRHAICDKRDPTDQTCPTIDLSRSRTHDPLLPGLTHASWSSQPDFTRAPPRTDHTDPVRPHWYTFDPRHIEREITTSRRSTRTNRGVPSTISVGVSVSITKRGPRLSELSARFIHTSERSLASPSHDPYMCIDRFATHGILGSPQLTRTRTGERWVSRLLIIRSKTGGVDFSRARTRTRNGIFSDFRISMANSGLEEG